MKIKNNILQKFRKIISFSLILNLLLFSSGQAYIFSDCACDHSEKQVVESSNCCGSEISNDVVKYESTTSHSCEECSNGCSVDENIDYKSPTLFASISFSLKKLDRIELDNIDFSSEKLKTCEIYNRLTHTQNNVIPKLFGKNLLIKTHTLKIPLILV